MDGFKKRLKSSVQLRLSFSLSLAIFVVAVVAGIFSFVSAMDEAHELQDDVLRQVAVLFERQQFSPSPIRDGGRVKDGDEESQVFVQYLADDTTGDVEGGSPLPLPKTLTDGLHTLTVSGEPFRILVKTVAGGKRIAVAQETEVRDEIARDSALRTVMPILVLAPILLLVVADLVRKMFKPIATLSTEIDQRAEQELHAIEDGHLPAEIRPFIVAINRLLKRVGLSMEAQRRFVADAAHELRSPLTALSLQAERLAEADMPELARERLIVLRQGIERGQTLLEQLLTLAKAQAAPEQPGSTFFVQHIYRRVLEDLLPLAEIKHIDIGVEGDQDVAMAGNEADWIIVIKNLVDNAIRYTPDGGRIDLSVAAGDHGVVMKVRDTGPGIPVAERVRVFDPFYRVLGSGQIGSGLGLSIVKAIADRIGASIELTFSDPVAQTGLMVTVSILSECHENPDTPDICHSQP